MMSFTWVNPTPCGCVVGAPAARIGSAAHGQRDAHPARGGHDSGWRRLRAVDASTWAQIGFAALCVGALVGYFAFPTYPTYDSFYALLWGRDLLHLHLPDFRVYRGPTEHPLAIAFGTFCSIFGQGGARLMVLGSIASFVALVAGIYRLGTAVLRPGRRAVRGAARAEPLLRREPRRAGLPRHHLRRADRVGDRARGRAPAPRARSCSCCSPPPDCCAPTPGC